MVADAAVIPSAVTGVSIVETKADTWSQIKVHVDWTAPDGTKAGDTFTLQLPPELEATSGMRFTLKDEGGQVVANAVVGGDTVTFTMTDYAQNHLGVHGSAWFWTEFSDIVKPGDDLDLVFTVGSSTFTDEIAVGDPGPGNPNYPSKWQAWQKTTEGTPGSLLWGITGPVVAENMVGATYQIVDTPGEGQSIDCSKVSVWSGVVTTGADFNNATWVAKDRWNLTCSPTQASVTVKPTANEIGRSFRLLGQSEVTDDTLTEYRNSGFVRLWGTAELPVSSVIRAGGGGEGTGVTPSPTTTAPGTPNPTTPVPTDNPTTPVPTDNPTTSPGSPAPTDNPTTPVPTVTVTVPGPTTTVTSPGQPAPTIVVPGQPVPTVGVTVGGPTVIVTNNPGTPAPTVNPGQTLNPGTTPTTDAPTVTVTATAPATTTPVSGGTPISGGTPTVTRTVTATPTTTLSGSTPVKQVVYAPGTRPGTVNQANPTRIDTGVPEQGIDLRLVGAGGGAALLSGIGLVAVSRRRPQGDDA